MSKLKIYVARAMTGRIKSEVVAEAKADKKFLEDAGFEVLDPVTSEGVEETKDKLESPKNLMDVYWPRDKQMIREAHAVFVMSPNVGSLGCIREYGYARYFLWKKTTTIFPAGKLPKEGAVCYYEDDYVTDDLRDAIGDLLQTHDTLFKRLKWRVAIYNKSLFRALYYKFMEWWK